MTLLYEITKSYNRNKDVYVCGMCMEEEVDKPMHSLDNRVWVEHSVVKKDYKHERYGLCLGHRKEVMKELYTILQQNDKTRIQDSVYLSSYG